MTAYDLIKECIIITEYGEGICSLRGQLAILV